MMVEYNNKAKNSSVASSIASGEVQVSVHGGGRAGNKREVGVRKNVS
jgi:hypothetical protein